MLQVVSATYARNNFSELLNLVTYRGNEFVVEKKGKRVARLIPEKPKKTINKQLSEKEVHELMEDMTKHPLKIKSWEEFKELISDLHDPKIQ